MNKVVEYAQRHNLQQLTYGLGVNNLYKTKVGPMTIHQIMKNEQVLGDKNRHVESRKTKIRQS